MRHLDEVWVLIVKFVSMLLVILMPVHSVMLAISALVILDLITGLWAAKKNNEVITSTGLKKTVTKTLVYQMSIIAAFVIEKFLLEDVPTVKVVAGLIAVTEGKSFFENIHRISGVDFWAEAFKKIQVASSRQLSQDGEMVVQEEPKKSPRKRKKNKKK